MNTQIEQDVFSRGRFALPAEVSGDGASGGTESATGPEGVAMPAQQAGDRQRGGHSGAGDQLPKLLLPGEEQELKLCEDLIESGLEKSIETAVALNGLARRLYRKTDATFEAYCERRWGLRVRQAYRLLAHFATLKALNGIPEGESVSNWSQFTVQAPESQTRPFLNLPLEHRRPAWEEAVASAPGGKMTAKHGDQVVRDWQVRLGIEPKVKTQRLAETTAAGPIIEAQPGGKREDRLRDAAEKAIMAVRDLLALAGTADSSKAAGVHLTLETLQDYRDHLQNVETMQASRA